jgi:hypothetical protein
MKFEFHSVPIGKWIAVIISYFMGKTHLQYNLYKYQPFYNKPICAAPTFCHRQKDIRIVGGDETTLGEFKFVVSLQRLRKPDETMYRHFCAGSILDEMHIVTAAHVRCFLI